MERKNAWQKACRMTCGVLELCKAKRCFRNLLKLLIVIICAGGFFFQTYQFMTVYWTYPTVVDVRITNPNEVELPAITVCSYNGVLASKFCGNFSEYCSPKRDFTRFCEGGIFCDSSKGKPRDIMPAVGPAGLPKMSWKEYRDLGQDPHSLIQQYGLVGSMDRFEKKMNIEERRWVGVIDTLYVPNACYALNSNWENVIRKPIILPRKAVLIFLVINEEIENFYTAVPPSFQLAVHDPQSMINPFLDGFSLRAGGLYYVYVKETVKHLLKAPYSTNCTDYNEQWRARGGKGPLTAKQCTEECVKNLTVAKLGCAYGDFVIYEDNEPFCYIHPKDVDDRDFTLCASQCSPACNSWEYHVEIEEQGRTDTLPDIVYAEVRVSFARMEVVTYSYNPKYESVELFSYVGGYIGMWLGISLLTVYDFMETIWIVVRRRLVLQHQVPPSKDHQKTHVREFRRNGKKPKQNSSAYNQRWETY